MESTEFQEKVDQTVCRARSDLLVQEGSPVPQDEPVVPEEVEYLAIAEVSVNEVTTAKTELSDQMVMPESKEHKGSVERKGKWDDPDSMDSMVNEAPPVHLELLDHMDLLANPDLMVFLVQEDLKEQMDPSEIRESRLTSDPKEPLVLLELKVNQERLAKQESLETKEYKV